MNNDHNFDVLGITELFGMGENECILPGYHPLTYMTRNDTDRSRGGIGIYVKSTIKYDLKPDLCVFIPNVFESRFVELHLGNRNVIVGTIYRPNSFPTADIDIFSQTMNELDIKA